MGQDVRVKHRVRMWIAWCQQLLAEYQRARVSLFSGGMAYFVALSLVPAALAFGAIAGRMTRRKTVSGDMPKAWDASTSPRGIASIALRKISAA